MEVGVRKDFVRAPSAARARGRSDSTERSSACRARDAWASSRLPTASGEDEFMTTMVEIPAGARSDPNCTVWPVMALSTAWRMTLLAPASGGLKSVEPPGRPFMDVAASSPGATDHPASGSTEGSPNHSTRYPPAVLGARVLSDSATLEVGRSKRPEPRLWRNGRLATTSVATESPAATCRHPNPASRRSCSSAPTPRPISDASASA